MVKFNNYFKRQIQLWGQTTQQNLQDKSILIVGCGGLGCSVATALGATGIGMIDLVDFDLIEDHNIHRQIAFTTNDIGKSKSQTLKNAILLRSPFVKINAFDTSFDKFRINNKQYNLIIDATDNLQTRKDIDTVAKELHIPWIYGSVEDFYGQVCFFDKSYFDDLFNTKEHQNKGIATPMVMHIASLQSNLAIRFLTNDNILKDTLYYCSFDEQGQYIVKAFGLE